MEDNHQQERKAKFLDCCKDTKPQREKFMVSLRKKHRQDIFKKKRKLCEAPVGKHNYNPPDFYKEDLDLRGNVLIVKETLQNCDFNFDEIFSYLHLLKKLLGDDDLTLESATYIMEENMLDLILGFLSKDFTSTLNEDQACMLINEILMIVNGLVSKELNFLVKYKILDKRYGVINFLHENLQSYDKGPIIINTFMTCGNIAMESMYCPLLRKTNFLAKSKYLLELPTITISLENEILDALRYFIEMKLSPLEAEMIVEMLSRFLFLKEPNNNPFGAVSPNWSRQISVLRKVLEIFIEMTNTTDIVNQANEYGVLLKLNSMLLDSELEIDMETEDPPEDYESIKCLVVKTIGAILSSEESEPINELLEQGIMDNLMKACDTNDLLCLEKVLWVACNISVTSESTAMTVSKTELFEYAANGLMDDAIESADIKNEACMLLINTFCCLPQSCKVDIIAQCIGKDNSKFLITLVKSLSEIDRPETQRWILDCLHQIFSTARDHPPFDYHGSFLADILDEFVDCSGPETIDAFLEDENEHISKIANELYHEYLDESYQETMLPPPEELPHNQLNF
ncbi:unnamed protein product [Moneuplotes crassus]|uniref:Uncharacterized protein n=1 Tax=Euplotes crassus TaxID=5936 RepID=A0AAD1U686_EUPCR|nr:unnamed protein product [Moneuplotes crassus]